MGTMAGPPGNGFEGHGESHILGSWVFVSHIGTLHPGYRDNSLGGEVFQAGVGYFSFPVWFS
jgi:hypothetical protein